MSLINYLWEIYEKSKIGHHPISDSYPLLSSPLPTICILLAYWIFVFYAGPKFMENRKPFQLKKTIIAYNLYQIIFSTWLLWRGLRYEKGRMYLLSLGCIRQQLDLETLRIGWDCGWWFMINKIVELLDTVFFVLKKKQNQVTFLHVYHHSNMELLTFVFLKYAGAEQLIIIGFINSIVHVIMYFYYLLAALGPSYKRFLGWKKYMTTIQIVQFILILLNFITNLIMQCPTHKVITYLLTINTIIFLVLFINFYVKTYNKNQADKLRMVKENSEAKKLQ